VPIDVGALPELEAEAVVDLAQEEAALRRPAVVLARGRKVDRNPQPELEALPERLRAVAAATVGRPFIMMGRAGQILAAGPAAAVLEADSVHELCESVAALARAFEVVHRQLAPFAIQSWIASVAEAAAEEELSL
jgi:hypothetical protein